MKVGMLWFDGDLKINLGVRIERAAIYYRDKYGRPPNLCIIHPSTAGEDPPRSVIGVDVRTSAAVQPDHFWLGIKEWTEAPCDMLPSTL
ncbi:MAG TPA: hypothetical protein G4O11_09205 [Anaerolineae bacterium]|nr:MAG: hypothetical protein AMJ88_17560 [Anaerolineae bacterium SM23_ 63]HEY44145.1 hypothetical protein [Anaerolineae bacterium]